MPQRNLLILLVALAASYACFVRGEQNPFARYVAQGLAEIEKDALARVPNEELFNGAMGAMIGVLNKHGDQHSQFIPSVDADPFQAELRQQFGGIGVRIRLLGEPPDVVVVGSPEPGTPAARADIRANDRVLEIDDVPTAGLTMSQILQRMRGEPGQPIRLLVHHAAAEHPEVKELVREVISVASILGDRRNDKGEWEFALESDPRIAHVRITAFGDRTTDELASVLAQLTDEGVEGIVLDLRDNSGGSLDAAVAICDMLLPAGQSIVEIRGRDGVLQERYTTSGRGRFTKLSLAVLVNSNTASASEIVAACLQDHGRAVVLGERTYGKGTVQKLISIESGRSLMKLTSASYHRPNGKNIHRLANAKEEDDWGVSPNSGFEVPVSDEQFVAFATYRSNRDLWGEPPPLDSTPIDESADDPADQEADADFADRPLDAAVEYLESILGSEQSA